MTGPRFATAAAVAVLTVAAAAAVVRGEPGAPGVPSAGTTAGTATQTATPSPAPSAASRPPQATAPTPSASRSAAAAGGNRDPIPSPRDLAPVYEAAGIAVPQGEVAMPGCPPPPPTPGSGGGGTPWHPAVTIPEDRLPAPLPAGTWTSDLGPLTGKGMWIWQYGKTEDGDMQGVVDRAVAAGLGHLWVRVGDSRDGFYAADRLEVLAPLAHAAGLAVIGWGFPFLHDPVGDAAWTQQALAWRGPDGRGLDAFSPDIEMATEGVELSPLRVAVYLGLVREAAGAAPIYATVYPPVDWVRGSAYPYETMARYVDAFVPMAYWMCTQPGGFTATSVDRLVGLRPVHVIGQAFGNTDAGRRVTPSRQETLRFLDTALRHGAVGASLWVWQAMGEEQWQAMTDYPWDAAAASLR